MVFKIELKILPLDWVINDGTWVVEGPCGVVYNVRRHRNTWIARIISLKDDVEAVFNDTRSALDWCNADHARRMSEALGLKWVRPVVVEEKKHGV